VVRTRGRVAIPETVAGEAGVAVKGISLSGGGRYVAYRKLHHGASSRCGQKDMVSNPLHDRDTSLGDVSEAHERAGSANAYASGEVEEQRYRGRITALRATAIMNVK